MSKVIWIINQTAGNLDLGWGERHYFLSKYWVNKGYKIKIISGSYNHLFLKQPKTTNKRFTIEKFDENIDFCWVNVLKYKNSGYSKMLSNFSFTLKLFLLDIKELEKPNVIIISSMPIFPIINGSYFKKKFNVKKLIIEVRDLWPLTPIYLKNYSKNNPLIKILSWFEKYAYQKSDHIVSLLPNASNYVNSISKDATKFNYIPNGIDEKLLGKDKLEESITNKIPKNKFIIGYTGTIGLANAMEYFVEASLKITNKNIHFVIVGDGFSKDNLKKTVVNSNNITFIDKIKKSQVQEILSFFDVCYIGRYKSPLYKHGVSYNKYFDYMLAKKPILESSEYIKDQVELSGCGIIVKPESAEAIIKGIDKMYKLSSEERKKIGMKGYVYVKKYHSFEYLSKTYEKLF